MVKPIWGSGGMVDTLVLETSGLCPCRFKSCFPHHLIFMALVSHLPVVVLGNSKWYKIRQHNDWMPFWRGKVLLKGEEMPWKVVGRISRVGLKMSLAVRSEARRTWRRTCLTNGKYMVLQDELPSGWKKSRLRHWCIRNPENVWRKRETHTRVNASAGGNRESLCRKVYSQE